MSKSIQIHDPETRETAAVEPGTQALRVYDVNSGGGGGGGGDVNIIEIAGNAISGPSLPIDDGGGSITVDGTVAVSGTVDVSGSTVTIQEPLSIDDNGGSITVDGTVGISGTVDVSGSTVTIQEPLSIDDNGGSLTVDDGGGSLTVDFTQPVSTITPYSWDAARVTNDRVWPVGLVRTDTLATLGPAVGDYVNGRANNRGALWVKQDGTVTVAGTVVVGPTVTPGTAATNLGKAEDAAHVSGDVGVMSLAVRNDAGTALAGTTGDYIPLTTDAQGALWVRSIMIKELLSTSVLGAPTTITAVPANVHQPPANVRDLITLYVTNNNVFDDELVILWTNSGLSATFFCPAKETVPVLVQAPIEDPELLGAVASNPHAAQSLEVFGFVERVAL